MALRFLASLPVCAALLLFALSAVAQSTTEDEFESFFDQNGRIVWGTVDADGRLFIPLYFFWSTHCPHCQTARPQIEQLDRELEWLKLHSLNIDSKGVKPLYQKMATQLGQQARSVPGFLFCGAMTVGFDEASSAGRLRQYLQDCRESYLQMQQSGDAQAGASELIEHGTRFSIPGLGEFDGQDLSLPVLTLVLAGLDSFNPCAFFVLLFLLSLLVHARDRARMLLIGGLFVLVSGVVYFMFMAAWLNLFMWLGDARWLTMGAGVVAVLIALLNIKDFAGLNPGLSLSIPQAAKPGLFQRMRGLLSADSLPTLIVGTVILALVANSYELLCTAGFPMVYTRALTLHELPLSVYYAYLVAYNVVYVIPLLLITLVFIITLGSRKLQQHEGRVLKLMSGTMMLGLGLMLIFAPQWLNNIAVAIGLLLVALLVSVIALAWQKSQLTD